MAGELERLNESVACKVGYTVYAPISDDLRALLQLVKEQHELLQCATSFDAVEGGWDVHARVMEQYKSMGGE